MPTTCQINFENNPQKVVHSGELFRGTVQLNLAEEVNVRGIYIQLYGGAYTHWRERFKCCRTHTGNEDYLNQRTFFAGGTSGEVRLSPGVYNYEFGCKLPPDLPTSFEGKFGYIRYTALVVIDNKTSPEKTFSESFTVIREVDLNYNRDLRSRIIVEKRKKYRRSILMFCWCPDSIRITTRTTVGGFAPGQMINLDMIVDNKTAIPISKFTVHLIRKVTYFESANSKDRRIETSTINKQDARGIDRYTSKIILANVEVPPSPPSDFSSIISVEHLIRIVGVTPCCRTNVSFDFPVTIGTSPIRDKEPTEAPNERTASFRHPSRNGASTSSATNDTPPVYEDEFHRKKGKAGKKAFKPKYPVFRSTTTYSSRTSP